MPEPRIAIGHAREIPPTWGAPRTASRRFTVAIREPRGLETFSVAWGELTADPALDWVVMLDDGSAQIEMTVFNDLFEPNRNWLRDDQLVVARGRASMDEYSGGMRISADALHDFASARAVFAKRLDIDCSMDDKVCTKRLAEMLKPYRGGECTVQINYRNLIGAAPLRLGEEWKVTLPEELLTTLSEEIGHDKVRVVYS
jgi:DNA polymerase-3 subunit alpha